MGRTRVLHIIQNLNYGGMERLLADIVLGADAERFEFHVLCFDYLGRYAEEIRDGAGLHLVPAQTRWSMLWPRETARAIQGIGPDVVHSHSGVWHKAALAARLAGVGRVIHTEHGRRKPDPRLHRWVDGVAAWSTDLVIAVSEVLAGHLLDSVVRRRAPVRVIRNGVDTTRHRPTRGPRPLAKELRIERETLVLGSIGRLRPIKGYDVMIRAFARFSELVGPEPASVLVIAGEGTERESLTELAGRLGVGDNVRILGWRDDIEELHASFDLFTMSSRSEGTSVSLLEAMSAGLCPVVTDVGGNAAVLGVELAHRLVTPEDPEHLARAWLQAAGDPERRRRDGANARRRVEEHFSLERMVRRYEAVYLGGMDALDEWAAGRECGS